MRHAKIINIIIKKFGYKTYLEIGVFDVNGEFSKINISHKVGVDPAKEANATHKITSDEYFEQFDDTFDIIFIDGLHHAEQAYRDILNSLKILNKGGTIIVHDCMPTNEKMQEVPRKQVEWTGDVWKAFVRLRSERDDLKMFVIKADYGVGIIRRGSQEKIRIPEELTWKGFENNKKHWLNLVNIELYQSLL